MSVIDDYLKDVLPEHKAVLENIRKLVHQEVPEVEESISYDIPVFKYKQKPVLWFASFKDHMSLFPMAAPIQELDDKLKDFKRSKGTIQFTVDKPLPESIIKEIIKIRLLAIEDERH